jgi:hypothetical protein
MKPLYSATGGGYTLLVDSIDDYWEGTDEGLIYLTAFMHACLEVSSQLSWGRALLFLRENIFERVRARDSEFSRLETAVVGLDWTRPQLIELVERRLNKPFNTRVALGGQTFDTWFESSDTYSAREELFGYCHNRPRDVLTYVSHAIESASAAKNDRISISDLIAARRRFSDNRCKDLGDEYAENYPQIGVVLSRFYGLGRTYTIGGMESFMRKLLADKQVSVACGEWIYNECSSVETFARLLYNIGFIGFKNTRTNEETFRSLGPMDTTPPAVSDSVDLTIHPTYWNALDLQDILVRSLPDDVEFGRIGIVSELPGGISPDGYVSELEALSQRLQTLPAGQSHASEFEEIVGDVLKLCFFRSLENPEPRVRDIEGRVIRDWIVSNRAQGGFWQMIREQYNARQVIWECKNYEDLKADDFHQASYYLNEISGRFMVLAFRGREIGSASVGHIKRIMTASRSLVLLLTERDLQVFIRQAKNGKLKEDHIQSLHDSILRKIG